MKNPKNSTMLPSKLKPLLFCVVLISVALLSFIAGEKWSNNRATVAAIESDSIAATLRELGNFSENLLADTEAYKNVKVRPVDDSLIIEDKNPPAGLFFHYKLNKGERYSVAISGSEINGRATMRVRKNNGKPEYLRAPEGTAELNVYGVNELELLFYSDSTFSYRLSKIVLDSCPASMSKCKTDEDLRNLILHEVPELKNTLVTDRFEAASLLLNWTANIIDQALSKEVHDKTMSKFGYKSASEIYYRIFLPDAGAVWCGGAAVFFNKVARLFEFMSFTIDFGDTRDYLTHVTCVIAFTTKNSWRYFIFDPTFNFSFHLKKTKGYASVSDLVEAIKSKTFSDIYISEKDLSEREYIAVKKDSSKCKKLKYENDQFIVCTAQDSIRSYFQRHREALIRNGYSPELPNAYLQLFAKRIFSIGTSTDPAVSQNFANSMKNAGIPLGAP